MDTPRRFPTLVQLMQPKAMPVEVLGHLPKRFSWFHSEFLKNPKVVRLEVWLVEKIFGRDRERIPHVQGMSQILIHVNRLDPNGEAEILVFGRPSYQEDTIKMIMNLADYHRQLQAKGSGKALAQDVATKKAETQLSSTEVREAGTQHSVEVREAGTPCSVEVREAGTQGSPVEVREAGTQGSPVEVRETGTQQSLEAANQSGTQRSPKAASKAVTQRFREDARAPVTRL
uniref:KH domain-containing protein 3 n=1 Tax=Chlorocebus sabaeus TaxID=60711 RepID=A0A0D9RN76_CHLSB